MVVVFDGAGTMWIPELAGPEHRYHDLFESVRGTISGACEYCATAYSVTAEVKDAGIALLDEYAQHPSLRSPAVKGYTVMTF